MSGDGDFGARFLAELRRLGVGPGNWNYATVTAIENADRLQFVELFKQRSSQISHELIQLAQTGEPEALARRIVEGQQAAGILPLLLLSL